MRALFFALLILVAAALGTHYFLDEPGYVLFAYGNYTIETSLIVFLLGGVLAFIVMYLLLRLLAGVWAFPGWMRRARKQRLERLARRGLDRGLTEMAEGRWEKAERLFTRAARRTDAPLVHYLEAARCAHMLGADDRRDLYLRRAQEHEPKARLAAELTMAEFQLERGHAESARAILKQVETRDPDHPYALRLRALAMQRIGDSAGLFALLPRLRKLKDMDDVALDAFETPAVRDEITRLTKAADLAGLDAAWRALPRYLRERPALACAYVDALSTLGQTARAESVLRNALRHAWHDTLIDLYGSMPHQDLPRAIAFAERFLRERELERNAALLLALGRLCRRERLWGKARGYFDASLASQPRPDTYRELGDLLEQLGERDPARHCFRKGLRLAAEGVLDNGQTLYLPTRRRAPELPPPRKGDEELHTV